ncbi:hypothetical protein [Lentisalinibacter sediminis]|uniref:hypothetical protein n=1 Tax=Lentisalinibacter sediminis TaxID=2992237 RepID=UPI00386B6CB0
MDETLMQLEREDPLDVDDEFEDEDMEDADLAAEDDADDDNVGELSVEINVEQLVAEIEGSQSGGTGSFAARRRLEELMEQKRFERALRDMDDWDFDD